SVSIASDGTISVVNAGTTSSTSLGQLSLVRFPNPAGLSAEGRNLMKQTDASGEPLVGNPNANGFGTLRQGYLERSNVDVVTELVNLIVAQRAYEFNTRAIRTVDTMLGNTTDLVR